MSKRCKVCTACGASDAYLFRGLYRCKVCADRLIEEDPTLQEELASAIELAVSAKERGQSRILTLEETKGWLRQVAENALSE